MEKTLLSGFLSIFFCFIGMIDAVAANAIDEIKETKVVMTNYGTVTFHISGKAGTYTFIYPEQKTVTVNGLETVTIPLNVNATAGLSGAVVFFKVKANSSANEISIFSENYKETIDLDNEKSANVSFIVPLSNGSSGTATVRMGIQ